MTMSGSAMYRIGTIGFDNMDSGWAKQFAADPHWELVRVCDRDAGRREEAAQLAPGVSVCEDAEAVHGVGSLFSGYFPLNL